jgi:hypothetical protein
MIHATIGLVAPLLTGSIMSIAAFGYWWDKKPSYVEKYGCGLRRRCDVPQQQQQQQQPGDDDDADVVPTLVDYQHEDYPLTNGDERDKKTHYHSTTNNNEDSKLASSPC